MRTSYDQSDVGRLIDQLTAKIAAGFKPDEPLNIVGIRTRGEVLAERLSKSLQARGFKTIGRGVLEPSDPEPIVAALTGDPDPENVPGMVFRRLADGLGNDRAALIAFLRRPQRPLTQADLARITTHVLVVLGDQDPAGTLTPGDGLVAALPGARLVTLRGVDHFGTPADVRCMQAVLDFLGC